MLTFCIFFNIASTLCYTAQPIPPREPIPIHYSRVVERSTELIIRHEGLALQAYPDTLGWSIGYGTRSYAGEVITQPEAYKRMERIVAGSVHNVMRDFPQANENQIVALTSVYYNCWSGYLKLKHEGIEKHLSP